MPGQPGAILVLGCQGLRQGEDVARHWTTEGALLVTPRDLSRPGWFVRVGHPGDALVAVGERLLPANEIRGVVTALPWITADMLGHIVPEDRSYVASEMTAFVASWLDAVSCPVFNQPTPTCLCGPGWPRQRWLHEAARLGVRVVRQERPWMGDGAHERSRGSIAHGGDSSTVTIVGTRWYGDGDVDDELGSGLVALAGRAGVALLTARVSATVTGPALHSVDVIPDLASPVVAAATLDLMRVAGYDEANEARR